MPAGRLVAITAAAVAIGVVMWLRSDVPPLTLAGPASFRIDEHAERELVVRVPDRAGAVEILLAPARK